MASKHARDIYKRLGKNIKTQRKKIGLTQEEAAYRSKLGYKRWQCIEAGKANTTVSTLNRIASVLKVDIQKLLAP